MELEEVKPPQGKPPEGKPPEEGNKKNKDIELKLKIYPFIGKSKNRNDNYVGDIKAVLNTKKLPFTYFDQVDHMMYNLFGYVRDRNNPKNYFINKPYELNYSNPTEVNGGNPRKTNKKIKKTKKSKTKKSKTQKSKTNKRKTYKR